MLGVPAEMAVWLKERNPENLDELGRLADEYALARQGDEGRLRETEDYNLRPIQIKQEHSRSEWQRKNDNRAPTGRGRVQVNSQGDKRCYACGQYGHLSYSCPNKHSPDTPGQSHKALFGEACKDVAWNKESQKYIQDGTVDGRPVKMLVDTGCTRTIVASTVVRKSKVTPKNKVPILCVHGDTCLYPTARVKLMCGNWEKEMEVAVAPNLPVAVLLGSDIHSLVSDKPTANVATIDAQSAGAELPNVSSGLIAVMRSQSKRKVEQTEAEPSAKPRDATGVYTAEEEPIREEAVDNLDMAKFPYWGEEEVTMQETWENTEIPSSDTSAIVSVTNHMEGSHDEIEVLNATPDILKTWQQEDESLEKIRKFADGTTMEDPESSVKFLCKEGVLY